LLVFLLLVEKIFREHFLNFVRLAANSDKNHSLL